MNAYDRILDQLDGVKRNGTKATAKCPAHEDSSPSLSLKAIEGQTLMYCHAGCDNVDVMAAVGLTLGDLYDDRGGATYNYPDRQVRRTYVNGKKRFYQSGHISGAATTLYRLDRIEEARTKGEPVILVGVRKRCPRNRIPRRIRHLRTHGCQQLPQGRRISALWARSDRDCP